MKNVVNENLVKGGKFSLHYLNITIGSVTGGLVRHALEMFDEFKYVPEHFKTETIRFSLSNVQICIRYTA